MSDSKSKIDKSSLPAIINPKQLMEQAVAMSKEDASFQDPLAVSHPVSKVQAPDPENSDPQELTTCRKRLLEQQHLLEKLTTQLQEGQDQIQALEQQLAQVQQQCDRQNQQLQTTETLCQELRIRLQRQQQYTQQFKAALEKCIELSDKADVSGASREIYIPLPIEAIEPSVPRKTSQAISPWPATPVHPPAASNNPAKSASLASVSPSPKTELALESLTCTPSRAEKSSPRIDLPRFTRR